MAARVNVLKDISASMARELGREATLAELAERMKMSEDEIRDIMKLTMDAMKVSGQAAEMAQKAIATRSSLLSNSFRESLKTG